MTEVKIPIIDDKLRQGLREHLRKNPTPLKKAKQINHKHRVELTHGWMMSILAEADRMLWGRWDYWAQCQMMPEIAMKRWELESAIALIENRKPEHLPRFVIAETLPKSPIPQIDWHYSSSARQMLENTLDVIPQSGSWKGWGAWDYLEYFLDWSFYSFGHPGYQELPKEPHGCEGASMRLYQMFDVGYLLTFPEDYLGRIIPDICSKSGQRNQGFYPTPMVVTNLMSKILDNRNQDERASTFYEPACGTGACMLSQSNYCLSGIGQDIDSTLLKAALFQFYLYAPWYAIPIWWLGNTDLLLGNTLTGETPKSMNAKYWQEKWFEGVENNHKVVDTVQLETINCLTNNGHVDVSELPPEPLVQKVAKVRQAHLPGEIKWKTTKGDQLSLF